METTYLILSVTPKTDEATDPAYWNFVALAEAIDPDDEYDIQIALRPDSESN